MNFLVLILASALISGEPPQRSAEGGDDVISRWLKDTLTAKLKTARLVKSSPEECLIAQTVATHLYSGPEFAEARVRDTYEGGGGPQMGDLDQTGAEISRFLPELSSAEVRRFSSKTLELKSPDVTYGYTCDWMKVQPTWKSIGDLADVEALLKAPNLDAALARPRSAWSPCRDEPGRLSLKCDPSLQINIGRPVRPRGASPALVWTSAARGPPSRVQHFACLVRRVAKGEWTVVRCNPPPSVPVAATPRSTSNATQSATSAVAPATSEPNPLLGTWRQVSANSVSGELLTTFTAKQMRYVATSPSGETQEAANRVRYSVRPGGTVLISVLSSDGSEGGGLIALVPSKNTMILDVPGQAAFTYVRVGAD